MTPYLLFVELYGAYVSGGIITGSHTLGVGADDNYQTCAYCVRMLRCSDAQCSSSDMVFFATGGTLDLTTLSEVGQGAFEGSISGLSMVEVTIDEQYVSTEVPGGECNDLTAAHTLNATEVVVFSN